MPDAATKEVPVDQIVKELPRPQHVHIKSVENTWKERAATRGYKKGTKKYENAETEFFCGAMAGFVAIYGDHAVIPHWIMMIMSGRNIVE